MSVPQIPQHRPPDRPVRPPRWNPLVTGLMILVGIPLLAPGFCVWMARELHVGGGMAEFAMVLCLPGLALIGFGIRRLFVSAPNNPAISETAKCVVLLVLFIIVGGIVLWIGKILLALGTTR